MVRLTVVSRAGRQDSLDVPGSIVGVARTIAAATRGIASFEVPGKGSIALRTADLVLLQLLDGTQPIAKPD